MRLLWIRCHQALWDIEFQEKFEYPRRMAKRFAESRALNSKAEVVRALGGVHAVSTLVGCHWKNVENWKRAKTFPSRYFLVMTRALERKGLSAPPELWAMVTPEQRKRELQDLVAAQRQRSVA